MVLCQAGTILASMPSLLICTSPVSAASQLGACPIPDCAACVRQHPFLLLPLQLAPPPECSALPGLLQPRSSQPLPALTQCNQPAHLLPSTLCPCSLNHFMKRSRLPLPVRRRLREFLRYRRTHRSLQDYPQLMQVLSPALRAEVAASLQAKWVLLVSLYACEGPSGKPQLMSDLQ